MHTNFHIIIVDDDEDDQLILRAAFLQLVKNIKITALGSGQKLLEYFKDCDLNSKSSSIPDAIILDINMPVMDGIEVLERIKRLDNFNQIPVFMLSTLRTIQRVDRSFELGALKYYSKPNHIKEYSSICTEILDNSILKQ